MKREAPSREKLPPVSQEMEAWAAALAIELRDWPQVTQKVFFGFTALYRGKTIFGLIPRTRSIFKGNAIAFRISAPNPANLELLAKDQRVAAFNKDRVRWFAFELSSGADLHDALGYLGRAFDAAHNSKITK